MVERLEIVAACGDKDAADADDVFDGDAFQILDVEKSAETLVSHVKMPRHLRVRPPDWRELAYDHEEARRCIVVCVTDNCRSFMAEPINGHILLQIQKTLSMVLKDLSPITDVNSVTCEPAEAPGRYLVSV